MRWMLLLLAQLAVPIAVDAQPQEDPAFLISGGITVPTAEYGESLQTGVNLGAAFDLPIARGLALQLAAGYYALPLRSERGHDSGLFGMGNLKVEIPLQGSSITPFVLGGLGVWRTGFSDLWIGSDGVTPRPPGEAREESRLAFNLGAGATLALTDQAGIFAQARYVMVRSDGPGPRMVPFDLGFRFSRR